MRQIDRYIKKYGKELGAIVYSTLQKQAAEARWKAFYRARTTR